MVKSSPVMWRPGFDPWVRKIWRRKWQPAPVLLPVESHGQRSLAGYSSWDRKESDTAERLLLSFTFLIMLKFQWLNMIKVCLSLSHCPL